MEWINTPHVVNTMATNTMKVPKLLCSCFSVEDSSGVRIRNAAIIIIYVHSLVVKGDFPVEFPIYRNFFYGKNVHY